MLSRAQGCLCAVAVLAAGCATYYGNYEASADRQVLDILRSKRHDAVDRWQKDAKMPAPEKPAASPAPAGVAARVLSLRDAVGMAVESNRDYKVERESVYLSALALSLRRHDFGPVLANTISYLYSNGATTAATGTASAAVGVSQVVRPGGTVSVSAGGSATHAQGAPPTFSHDLTVSFAQPLLKGFGREPSHESLTQAEQDVLYALRDFELFRESFLIDTVRRYYTILRQKHVVENSRRTHERFTFLRKRSEALFEIGKVSAIDKFRAAQEELVASNDLIAEQETLTSVLDEFKVFLGLPTDARIDVEDVKPQMRQANIDLRSALAAALHNRLDLRTSEGRLEDAERHVRNARNGLLPDLDLAASFGLAGTKTGGGPASSLGAHSIGLSLSLPLDKAADRNAYKSAIITLNQRTRAHNLAKDNIRVEVLNTYRRLRRLANSVRIQTANLQLAERRVKNAELRFEAGELGNRDVVEAQSEKLRAENALIRAILDYEVSRLQLKKDIGILFLNPEGMWVE